MKMASSTLFRLLRARARPDTEVPRSDSDKFRALTEGGELADRAFTQIFVEYAPRFDAFLRIRKVPRQVSEDLIHDVFLRLLEARAELTAVRSPRLYMWRMLRNAMVDEFRKATRKPIGGLDPVTGNAGTEPNEEAEGWIHRIIGDDGTYAERLDLVKCVAGALEELRVSHPEKAFVIELAAIEELNGREIAEVLGRSYGASRQFLSEARKALSALTLRLCGEILP